MGMKVISSNGRQTRSGVMVMVLRMSVRIGLRAALFFILMSAVILAQSRNDDLVNQITPESQFLDLVDLVADPEKQLGLLDIFLGQYPKYEGINTVHSQMQDLCVTLKLWDRALSLGDQLLKVDESDIEAVRLNVKAAEGKNDTALMAKWRDRLKQLEPPEGEVTASSTVRLPFVDDEPAGDIGDIDLTSIPKNQRPRVEAILFNRALEEVDSKRRIQLLSVFEKNFPASSHLGKVRYLFFLTHREAQDHTKAMAAAEAVLERDKTREDVLFYAAQTYFVTKREPAKVLSYSSMVLDLLTTKQKSDDISDEAWEKQKSMLTHYSHWMIGMTNLGQERFAEADKSLHTALATIGTHGADQRAAILTNLGWANYKLRNIPVAINYYEQCAAIRGPLQAAAAQSIVSIKSEYNLQ
jgi:tetratricopeptide (TPR) repeat protein